MQRSKLLHKMGQSLQVKMKLQVPKKFLSLKLVKQREHNKQPEQGRKIIYLQKNKGIKQVLRKKKKIKRRLEKLSRRL